MRTQPFPSFGTLSVTNQTLTGNNATVATPLFRITGTVRLLKLYGVITTVLGSNNTAAYYRLNDQTAQVDITLSTGTTLSSAAVGSVIAKKGLAAAAVILSTAAAGRILEPTTLETVYFGEFIMQQKTAGANTDIEFVYTTTNTPTSGVIQHFVLWEPISSGASLAVI